MIIKLRLLFSVLLTMAFWVAKAEPEIISPKPTGFYGQDLTVSIIGHADSDSMFEAIVNDRKVFLHYIEDEGISAGNLDLTGLPEGILQLTIRLKNKAGIITYTKSQNFNYKPVPTVTIISPVNDSAYVPSHKKLRIQATASQPGKLNCKGTIYGLSTFRFSFVNSIDTVIDILPNNSWRPITIYYGGTEAGVINNLNSYISIYVDESPYLKPFFTGPPGEVMDFKGDRALVREKYGDTTRLKIVNVLTHATETIMLDSSLSTQTILTAVLCEGGAVFTLADDFDSGEGVVYVWQNGSLNPVIYNSKPIISYYLKCAGKYLFIPGFESIIIDVTNLNVVFSGQEVFAIKSFSDQATLVYTKNINGRNVIEKYDAITNTTTPLITTPGNYSSPIIDSNYIVYRQNTNGQYVVHINDGVTDKILLQESSDDTQYYVKDGHVFYSNVSYINGYRQTFLWVRMPDGTNKQLSPGVNYNTNDPVYKLGNNGRILFKSGENGESKLFYADDATPAKAVSGSWDQSKVFINNNDFYLTLSGNLYKYDIASGAPVIKSITPKTAGKGQTVTITGQRFTTAASVTFGTVAASSYTIVSDTVITAIVDTGETGNVIVRSPAGYSSISGFTYLPPPQITSLDINAGNAQKLIVINGTGFHDVTAVSFGGVTASGFTVHSPTLIYARVSKGASGDVKVTTPYGEASSPGFIYVPIPTISANGTTMLEGDTITLTASAGDSFQWYRGQGNAVSLIPGATLATYKTTQAGLYTLRTITNGATSFSESIELTYTFSLPANFFKITNTSATCRGASNGSINVTAKANSSYKATVTGGNNINTTYSFSKDLEIKDLAAGTYDICVSYSSYSQCFTSVITQPADLSVYTSVIKATNNVVLSLAGGDVYYINLNGKTTETRAGQLTLALKPGTNTLSVNTDKACQGTVIKTIDIEDFRAPYPNPFSDGVNIDLGDEPVSKAIIRVYNSSSSKEVFNQQYINRSGKINLSLKDLTSGVYIVKLTVDSKETVYKVIKM